MSFVVVDYLYGLLFELWQSQLNISLTAPTKKDEKSNHKKWEAIYMALTFLNSETSAIIIKGLHFYSAERLSEHKKICIVPIYLLACHSWSENKHGVLPWMHQFSREWAYFHY